MNITRIELYRIDYAPHENSRIPQELLLRPSTFAFSDASLDLDALHEYSSRYISDR